MLHFTPANFTHAVAHGVPVLTALLHGCPLFVTTVPLYVVACRLPVTPRLRVRVVGWLHYVRLVAFTVRGLFCTFVRFDCTLQLVVRHGCAHTHVARYTRSTFGFPGSRFQDWRLGWLFDSRTFTLLVAVRGCRYVGSHGYWVTVGYVTFAGCVAALRLLPPLRYYTHRCRSFICWFVRYVVTGCWLFTDFVTLHLVYIPLHHALHTLFGWLLLRCGYAHYLYITIPFYTTRFDRCRLPLVLVYGYVYVRLLLPPLHTTRGCPVYHTVTFCADTRYGWLPHVWLILVTTGYHSRL